MNSCCSPWTSAAGDIESEATRGYCIRTVMFSKLLCCSPWTSAVGKSEIESEATRGYRMGSLPSTAQ